MSNTKRTVLILVWLVAIGLLIASIIEPHLWRDYRGWSGSQTNPNGTSTDIYQALSGLIPSLAILSVVGGLTQTFRHHNCHVKGCWRLGRPVDGTPYVACHVHHPAHEGERRKVDRHVIARAHAEAQYHAHK
jgi:hypothetical protein